MIFWGLCAQSTDCPHLVSADIPVDSQMASSVPRTANPLWIGRVLSPEVGSILLVNTTDSRAGFFCLFV